jgi:hypothetical protein
MIEEIEILKTDFALWRKSRRGKTDRIPPDLLAKAKSLANKINVKEVVKASGLPRRYFTISGSGATPQKGDDFKKTKSSPVYTKIQIATSTSPCVPLVEIENQSGVKLRLFSLTAEALQLASLFSNGGGLQ